MKLGILIETSVHGYKIFKGDLVSAAAGKVFVRAFSKEAAENEPKRGGFRYYTCRVSGTCYLVGMIRWAAQPDDFGRQFIEFLAVEVPDYGKNSKVWECNVLNALAKHLELHSRPWENLEHMAIDV